MKNEIHVLVCDCCNQFVSKGNMFEDYSQAEFERDTRKNHVNCNPRIITYVNDDQLRKREEILSYALSEVKANLDLNDLSSTSQKEMIKSIVQEYIKDLKTVEKDNE